ncbi:MAG: hypothetical protein Q9219_006191 [cf. Caloplaca sp. 3 TL-2023]
MLEAFELESQYEGRSKMLDAFISIGNGIRKNHSTSAAAQTVKRGRLVAGDKKLPDVHGEMLRLSRDRRGSRVPYFRLEAVESLVDIGPDEWIVKGIKGVKGDKGPNAKYTTLEKMRWAMTQYLNQAQSQGDLDRCARLLVRRRRFRARDQSAWDRYASASYYECSDQHCPERCFPSAGKYKAHLLIPIRFAPSILQLYTLILSSSLFRSTFTFLRQDKMLKRIDWDK